MNQRWTVDEQHSGWRLDKFLVEQLPDQSRSALQKLIGAGSVTVNDQSAIKHRFLETGDVVKMAAVAPTPVAPTASQPEIPILFEDDTLLVINKPTGVLVHPVPHRQQWTLVDWLLKHDPSIAGVGEDPQRPGIVHRLDREVSGVLLITKTAEAYQAVKQQFMERSVQKEYRAIVHGVPSAASDVIKFAIAHSTTRHGKMAARPTHEEGRDAWTTYDVLDTKQNRYAMLAVRIKTGRTHQIRVHLAAIDHPVVGDTLYASKHYRSQKNYPRLFLHALRLGLTHPITGERVTFEAPLPEVFQEFLA